MKVLVTGAAGFIGSHLTRALLDAGREVRAIDNLSTGQFWRIEPLVRSGAVEWLEADLRDPNAAARAVAGVDGVLHQAAIPSVSRSLVDPVASNDANVGGTITLLQACREAGVRRLVYAASSSAYGNTPTLPKVETMCPSPLSPYAVSKLAGEQYCQVFARLGYVETVCLRYFNIFGPMQDPSSQYAAVIPKFACAMLAGEPVTVQGDGSQSRDFTYVANAVQANLLALETPGVSGEMFNVGCGQRYDLNELICRLAEITGASARIEHLPVRPGDVPHSLADIAKGRRLLGYEPGVDFRRGLELTVSWLIEEGARRYPPVKAPAASL